MSDIPITIGDHHLVANRKYQIFVSSTFTDLIDERRAVTEVILSMGHIPVGMELFEAGNEDQWSYIRSRIAEVDYYILILAERYGSLGPGGISYTEMEYRHAIEIGVPVAGLLLDQAQRKLWPIGKSDPDNRKRLEAFRKLCQTRMVSHWSDAGSLTSKCQLALRGLFSRHPRVGWVPADQAVSPQMASELARLSQENAQLRGELAKYADSKRANEEAEAVAAFMREPLLQEIGRIGAKIGGDWKQILENAALGDGLDRATIFDLLINKTDHFVDGETQEATENHVRAYLVGCHPALEWRTPGLDNVVRVTLLRMKLLGIIEVYDAPANGPHGQATAKHIRLSALGRRAFEREFNKYMGA
jgi:hypothetical protein